jgi:uncharacterized protein DUF2330
MRAHVACLFSLVVLGAVTTHARHAAACGGTFCDSPPPNTPPMPVDQTGENILFAYGDGFVEAHVQIQYTGVAARFAWIVPVPAEPEIYVGSQLLFVNMLNGTVPTYRMTFQSSGCSGGSFGGGSRGGRSGGGFGCGAMSADEASGYEFGGTTSSGTGGIDPEPQEDTDIVEAREAVGAFDVTVLHATTAPEVSQWLSDNGFLAEDTAEPILQDYIDRGHRFVAVKLLPGNGVDEIHPLVIRYPGTEPCIPIVLTRIAAKNDMGVRAFFLGDRRVVPTGDYRHVELNPLKLDWVNLADDYVSEVNRAIDEAPDGHAFLTEYSGPSDAVGRAGVYSDAWDWRAFNYMQPQYVMQELHLQGLADCKNAVNCVMLHPLVIPLLRTYLPAPDGFEEAEFYSWLYQDPGAAAELVDASAWDGAAFSTDFATLIVEPGRRAWELLDRSPYLTRLYTTISPDEMTIDPTFAPAAEPMDEVTGLRSATTAQGCGSASVQIPDGRVVALDGAAFPSFSDMPYLERVEEYDADGNLMGEIDNGTDIDAKLQMHNEGKLDGIEVSGNDRSDDSGCACRATGAASTPSVGLFGLFALGLWRRLWSRRATS